MNDEVLRECLTAHGGVRLTRTWMRDQAAFFLAAVPSSTPMMSLSFMIR
jgi:hypothetical protein